MKVKRNDDWKEEWEKIENKKRVCAHGDRGTLSAVLCRKIKVVVYIIKKS